MFRFLKLTKRRANRSMLFFLASSFLALFLWAPLKAVACDPDDSIKVQEERDGKVVLLVIRPTRVEDATVTITADLKNMESSQPLPYTTDLPHTEVEADRRVVIRFKPVDPTQSFNWSWHSEVRYGNLGGKPDADFVYRLPFRKGERHRISQSYFGSVSHQKGSEAEYAVDISMPEGSFVCAAREGRVVALRDDSHEGGPSADFKQCDNFIIIRHADGGYGRYSHLRYKGVLVKLGSVVQAGTIIGLSGNTGFSSGPHLHFEVFAPVDGNLIKTCPFKCQTDEGVLAKLKTRKEYGF